MSLPSYASPLERLWHYFVLAFCGLAFLFLIAPILLVVPLSFNAEPYFTFTEKMLHFDPAGYSLRWYRELVSFGTQGVGDQAGTLASMLDVWNNATWIQVLKNSVLIGVCAAALATVLGTVAALGLSRPEMPMRRLVMALLISPMIVPVIITATGLFFFYSKLGLTQTFTGVILAHALLGIPFVIITVTATLSGFDHSLTRAGISLGASPLLVFWKIILPLVLPGVLSGALFAFATSFDEVMVVLFVAGFDQQTVPRQMFNGIREQISPTILAAATALALISVLLLATVELLRRRSDRIRGL